MTFPEGLDPVEVEEQLTQEIQLEEDLKVKGSLGMYSSHYPTFFSYAPMRTDNG
jgi:hypothetical protein